jgi:hypothetical protein
VPVGVVSYLKPPRGKSPGQFLRDQIAPAHRLPIRAPLRLVNAGRVRSEFAATSRDAWGQAQRSRSSVKS